jgi:hypothetical protein
MYKTPTSRVGAGFGREAVPRLGRGVAVVWTGAGWARPLKKAINCRVQPFPGSPGWPPAVASTQPANIKYGFNPESVIRIRRREHSPGNRPKLPE